MTYDWQQTFQTAIEAFGDTPGAELEQAVRDAFLEHPQAVTNAIAKITAAHRAGRVHSPWGALRAEIPKQVEREATVDDGIERRDRVRRAEQWLRNAGMHFDRWSEVRAELFGERGRIRDLHTPALEERMHALHLQVRPVGEEVEAEQIERLRRWAEQRRQELAR